MKGQRASERQHSYFSMTGEQTTLPPTGPSLGIASESDSLWAGRARHSQSEGNPVAKGGESFLIVYQYL